MRLQDTLSMAANALAKANLKFAVIGGFALAAHGVVRATQDIDLLVDGNSKDLVKNVLTHCGFTVIFENQEVMHLSGAGQLDILFANRAHTQTMLTRARTINEFPAPVVIAEDLIGLKIQAYKNDPKREFRDKADIQCLLENKKDLDFQLIKKYADLFNEWAFIVELRDSL